MHCLFVVIAVLATHVASQASVDPRFKFINFMECGDVWDKGVSDQSKETQYPRLCLNWCASQGTEYVWVTRNDETGLCRCLKRADCKPQLKEWNSLYLSSSLKFEALYPNLPTYDKCFPNVSC